MEKYKDIGGFALFVDDYKENGKFQFNLNTKIPFINTNKDFSSHEEAFDYAEKLIIKEFSKIVKDLKKSRK